MTQRENLQTGQRFGKLTVISLDHIRTGTWSNGKKYQKYYYKCLCECGNECVVEKGQLKQGKTRSCGCLQKEANRTKPCCHGMSKTKIYSIWGSIKDRCFREKCLDYKNYGGRGITIQKEWLNFKNFYNWAINNGYKEGLTIERINVNGNYEENNCTWIENKLQSHNTRANHYLTYNGKTQILSEWAREMNLHFGANISSRLKNGWTVEEALTIPLGQKRKSSIKA